MEITFPVKKLEKDLLLRVWGCGKIRVKKKELDECKEKQSHFRRKNMEEEFSFAGEMNQFEAYEMLDVNMRKVRMKPTEDRTS